MKPVVFFTIVNDAYYYPVGTHILVNTFRRFHPDIPLVVYRQDMIDKVMVDGINFYNTKPTFAKLLTDKYKLVVNIDADTIIMGRLDEVLKADYDFGAVWNFNQYENMTVENVTEKQYLQAGLVASTNPLFWDFWELANVEAMKYRCQENDVLNLLAYNHLKVKKMKMKIFDKDKDYYGCKSLGQEGDFYMEGKKVMLKGEQVLAYHHARGAVFPKLQFEHMGFQPEVRDYLKYISEYGQSETHETI